MYGQHPVSKDQKITASTLVDMKTTTRKVTAVALVSAVFVIGSVIPAAQATSAGTMALYFSAPFVTGSHVTASANTENFNGVSCPTNTSWYTATHSGCSPQSGLTGTSTGDSEPAVGLPYSKWANNVGGSVFTFNDNVKYVGVWWLMGSNGNGLEFLDANNNVVATLNVNEVVTFFGFANSSAVTNADTGTLNAVDGGTHFRKHYFRGPGVYSGTVANPIIDYQDSAGSYANEPWVYLNLFVSGDLAIKKLKFTGGAFEVDNLTVSTVEANPRGDMVFVKGVAGKSVQYLPGASGVTGSTSLQGSNTATNLRSNGFNRTGYTFTGWNTRQDGLGTAYASGALYSFSSDLTLYAQWELTPSPTPSPSTSESSLTAPAASSAPDSSVTNASSLPAVLARTGASATGLLLMAIATAAFGLSLLISSRNRIKRSVTKTLSRKELN